MREVEIVGNMMYKCPSFTHDLSGWDMASLDHVKNKYGGWAMFAYSDVPAIKWPCAMQVTSFSKLNFDPNWNQDCQGSDDTAWYEYSTTMCPKDMTPSPNCAASSLWDANLVSSGKW